MARLTIKCPTTGKDVATGIAMDPESFDLASLTHNDLKCPECDQMHSWSKADAFLE